MRDFTESNLTEAVLARLEKTQNPRLKQIMTSLIRHAHDFVREVELTEEEWMAGIQFLTKVGQQCDAKRQEFILLSDTLGISMLVDAINHRKPSGATESSVLGPFYLRDAPDLPMGANIVEGARGDPVIVSGRVLTPAGKPIKGALVDVWQTDGLGFYDVQAPDLSGKMNMRGRFRTGADGRFEFRAVKPKFYSIPTDGPVGDMLQATGRHPYRPAHIHFMVSAAGYVPVTTMLFVQGDAYLDSDAVFGVKTSLVVDFKRHDSADEARAKHVSAPFYSVEYDFGLKEAA
jgi:hydroxyquinol 1,2-dioxygenase